MRITDVRATTVTVPLEAPLLHANGAHWGRFVRTIVEVETDEGFVGWARWEAGERARSLLSRGSNRT
jgi:glucarate dehydratase